MTIDKTRLPVPAGTLPAFAPVPRKCNRHDGWTAERQRGFIEALADLGNVKAAAHAVNMSGDSAYQLRRHPEADEFRAAWEAALGCGVLRLQDIAMDRALNGVEVPVYSYGKLIGTRRVYNDYLLMFILRNRLGTLYAADARNPEFDLRDLRAKLFKQWRKEWERQHALDERERADRAVEQINAKLERMKDRRAETMSPRTRELYEAWQASQAEDERAAYAHENAEEDTAHEELAEGAASETAATVALPDEPPAEPEPAPAPERPAGPRVWRVDYDPYERFRRMRIEE